MKRLFQMRSPGPQLSPETVRRIDVLFAVDHQERAKALLYEQCGHNLLSLAKADMYQLERFRFAALKYSDGDVSKLESAIKLAQIDWRDLLMAAGFSQDVEAHQRWEPKPAGEPSEIDAVLLAGLIQERLGPVLGALDFERRGAEWHRSNEVPQVLRVKTGLTSRTEVKFFVQAILRAEPVEVVVQLPRLAPRLGEQPEHGYLFRAGDNEAAFAAEVVADVIRWAQPWFERFTTDAEVRRGFDDGTFHPHLRVGGQALVS